MWSRLRKPRTAWCTRSPTMFLARSASGGMFDATTALHNTPRTKAGALELYDSWASSYDADLASWGYRTPQQIAAILARLAPQLGLPMSAPLLDAGCGTGLSGEALARAGFSDLCGADISNTSLAWLREHKANVYTELVVADLDTQLPLESDAYTFVACCGVTSYVENFAGLYQEWDRVTRPGGLIVFSIVVDRWDTDARGCATAMDTMLHAGWQELYASGPEDYLPQNPEPDEAARQVFHRAYQTKV